MGKYAMPFRIELNFSTLITLPATVIHCITTIVVASWLKVFHYSDQRLPQKCATVNSTRQLLAIA